MRQPLKISMVDCLLRSRSFDTDGHIFVTLFRHMMTFEISGREVGEPALNFLDDSGKVVKSLGPMKNE
jgi:hypothetical protein